jgi:hypothetical protein
MLAVVFLLFHLSFFMLFILLLLLSLSVLLLYDHYPLHLSLISLLLYNNSITTMNIILFPTII